MSNVKDDFEKTLQNLTMTPEYKTSNAKKKQESAVAAQNTTATRRGIKSEKPKKKAQFEPEQQEVILQRKFENPQKVIQDYVQYKVR